MELFLDVFLYALFATLFLGVRRMSGGPEADMRRQAGEIVAYSAIIATAHHMHTDIGGFGDGGGA